jgi:hypothetical protein
MGAVTVVIKRRNVVGASKEVIADVTWSSSYASGGDTYVNSQFELDTIDSIDSTGASAAGNTGYIVIPDIANKKLKLLGGAASGVALAQASGDQSGTVARVVCKGNNPYI